MYIHYKECLQQPSPPRALPSNVSYGIRFTSRRENPLVVLIIRQIFLLLPSVDSRKKKNFSVGRRPLNCLVSLYRPSVVSFDSTSSLSFIFIYFGYVGERVSVDKLKKKGVPLSDRCQSLETFKTTLPSNKFHPFLSFSRVADLFQTGGRKWGVKAARCFNASTWYMTARSSLTNKKPTLRLIPFERLLNNSSNGSSISQTFFFFSQSSVQTTKNRKEDITIYRHVMTSLSSTVSYTSTAPCLFFKNDDAKAERLQCCFFFCFFLTKRHMARESISLKQNIYMYILPYGEQHAVWIILPAPVDSKFN